MACLLCPLHSSPAIHRHTAIHTLHALVSLLFLPFSIPVVLSVTVGYVLEFHRNPLTTLSSANGHVLHRRGVVSQTLELDVETAKKKVVQPTQTENLQAV